MSKIQGRRYQPSCKAQQHRKLELALSPIHAVRQANNAAILYLAVTSF